MAIVIRGTRYWLRRAVDDEGEVLDFRVQSSRDARAATKPMKKFLKRQGLRPTRIVTDTHLRIKIGIIRGFDQFAA